MKIRRAVLVSLVVAPLVLGVSAGGARAMSQPTHSGAHQILEARAWATEYSVTGRWQYVYGVLGVENLTGHRVRAYCTVTLFLGPVYSANSDPVFLSIGPHRVQRSPFYFALARPAYGKLDLYAHCDVL